MGRCSWGLFMKRIAYILAFLMVATGWAAVPPQLEFSAVSADSQQYYWDGLLKYKLWGRDYLKFEGQDVQLTETAGWTGTKGDFTLNNTNHKVLGVLVVGNDIRNADGNDIFDGGFVRVGNNIDVPFNARSSTYFNQQTCVHGQVVNGYGVFAYTPDAGDANCPAGFPNLETKLDVPSFTGAYGINTVYKDGGTIVVDGRPAAGDTIKDIYLDAINLQNSATLLIHQTQDSGLTRIFVKNMYLSATQWNIGVTYDGSTMIHDSLYRGSLLIYTESNLDIPAGTRRMQGSYISKGNISIQQGLNMAGQLVAAGLSVNSGFNAADFHYVPFDPPALDPTALASGIFYEGTAGDQTVNIKLSKAAVVDVTFKAWFIASGAGTDTADAADFTAGLLARAGAVLVTIPKDSTHPTVPLVLRINDDTENEGTEYFQIVIEDLEGAVLPNHQFTDTLALSIVDNDQEQPPVAADSTFSLPENSVNGTKVGTVTATDINPAEILTYAILSGNTGSAFALSSSSNTGVLTVADASKLNYEGSPNSWTLLVRVTDKTGKMDTATIKVILTNVNEAPTDIALSGTTVTENMAVGTTVGTLSATDPDAAATFTYSLVAGTGSTDNASFTVSGNKLLTSAVFNYETKSSYSVRVRVSDGALTYEEVFAISVLNVNEVPVAVAKTYTTNEDVKLDVVAASGLLIGATDPEATAMTVVLANTTGHGTLTLASDGSFSYTPQANYYGKDTLVFQVRDAGGLASASVQAIITVSPVNDVPVATAVSYSGNEDEILSVAAPGVQSGASDVDGDVLKAEVVTAPVFGTLSLSADGRFAYTPSLNYHGTDQFTFRVVDPSGAVSANVVATIIIKAVNDAPVGVASRYTVSEDSPLNVLAASGVLVGAVDVEGEALNAVLVSSSEFGSVTLNQDGSFVYTPKANFSGSDKFTFQVKDKTGALSIGLVARIDVTPVNDKPTLAASTFTVAEKSPAGMVVGNLVGSDIDGDILQYKLLAGSGFTLSASGVLAVAQGIALDFEKQSTILLTVQASDPAGLSAEANVTIKLTDVREASEVVIVSAQTVDSTWSYPDTIWVNRTVVQVEWTEDGVLRSGQETVTKNAVTSLVKTYLGEGQDTKGADTLVVIVNQQRPQIEFELPPERTDPIGGVTVVEQSDPADSVVYLNENEKDIVVAVKTVDSKLRTVVVTDTISPDLHEGLNTVVYSYTDVYGNTTVDSIQVFLDLTPPVVVIRTPEDGYRTEKVVENVEWTVDGVVMNVLNLQSLDAGLNRVIRSYRDKAGNEGSDTVLVYFVKGRDVVVKLEKSLLSMDDETIEKYYAVNPPEDDEFYSVSILNTTTGLEEQVLYGKGASQYAGDSSEPYVGMSGSHLGPTLVVRIRLPEIGGTDQTGNARGGLLGSLVEPDGRIAISAGAGENRVMVDNVDEYVEEHCLADAFEGLTDKEILEAALYRSKVILSVQVYDVTGQFVDQMSVVQDVSNADYLDDGGVLTMYFEIKPTREQGLQSVTGRKYGDGAYLLQANVKATSVRLCDMPDGAMGETLTNKETVLDKFGYRRDR